MTSYPDVHELPDLKCPRCGGSSDAPSAVDPTYEMVPKAGDITICVYCAAILVFTELSTLQECATDDPALTDPDILLIQSAVKKYMIQPGAKEPMNEDSSEAGGAG